MSLGFETGPLKNPNNCADPYAPSFWLGKPGALTRIRMPDAGFARPTNDDFAVHNLLDGESVDRSPYVCRTWQFQHQWLKPDVMSVFMEYATRQRGVGPFILIDPQMKNLLTPNQASGTDALHTSEGFYVDPATSAIVVLDTFTRTVTGSWGTEPVSGQSWNASAAPSAMSTTGTQARISTGSAGQLYYNTIIAGVPNGSSDHNVSFKITLPVVPLTQPITLRVVGRWADANNYYEAQLFVATSGATTLALQKRVLGVGSSIGSSVTMANHNANDQWQIVLDVQGSTIRGKAWNITQGGSDPGVYDITVTNETSLTSGTSAGAGVRRETGNTNGTVDVLYDDATITSYFTNALASSMDDLIQGERSLSWTMSPPVTGTTTTMRVKSPTGLYGFCIPPTSQSSKNIAFSGYVKLASTSLDASAQLTPNLVFMNGVGAVQSTLSGATITAVTGTAGSGWQAFCVTGSVPAGQSGVYVEPQFVAINNTMIATTVFLFDQLQLEIVDGTTCTQWEYGQGQPLVSVRSDSESVPRILRTNMNFICVEVT